MLLDSTTLDLVADVMKDLDMNDVMALSEIGLDFQ
jgi:hypothetical protein